MKKKEERGGVEIRGIRITQCETGVYVGRFVVKFQIS